MVAATPAAGGGPSLARSLLQLTEFCAVGEGPDGWDRVEDGGGGGVAPTSGGCPASDFFLSGRSTCGSIEAEGGIYKSGVESLRPVGRIEDDEVSEVTTRGRWFPPGRAGSRLPLDHIYF